MRVVSAAGQGQIEKAESFVFTVATNLLRDRKRQHARSGNPSFVNIESHDEGLTDAMLVEDLSPERVLLDRDTLAEALRVLEELGERTCNIFILFRLEKMKQRDIAALYGISQSTVEKHVVKAVLHLAERFNKK